jgi:hypothetical protein
VVELATVISSQETRGSQPLERFLRLLFGGPL